MTQTHKIKVMFVDEAVTMGGSLVVLAALAKGLPDDKYDKILVNALNTEDSQGSFHGIRSLTIRKLMNYVRVTHIQNLYYGRFHRLVIRALTYLLTIVAFVCNIPYYVLLSFVFYKEKPDLVHINQSYDALWLAILFRRRVIYHLHKPHPTLNVFRRLLFSRVYCFIAVSSYVKDTLPLPQTSMVEVMHNPLKDMSCREPTYWRSKLGLGSETKVVSLFGRLVRWKGHREFFNALQKVVAGSGAVIAVVVGGNEEYRDGYDTELKKHVQQLGIADYVVFTGHVQDVACLYEISDIVVHTSIEPEAFGLVIVEAMSFGKPVIVSDLGAPKEIVDHGSGGFVVSPWDTEQLAEKILLLLKDRAMYQSFSGYNLNKAMKYELDAYVQKVDQLYARVLNEAA